MVNKIQKWLVVLQLTFAAAAAAVFLALVVKKEFTDCTTLRKVECAAPKCVLT